MKNPSCPCGSEKRLSDCCGRLLAGEPADTAEALMRSRYSAYVLGNADYLLQSWHPSSRPDTIDLAEGLQWTGLTIRACRAGGPADSEGTVEFLAHYVAGGRRGSLHETSRFVRENGHWLYLDGDIHEPGKTGTVGRNQACPCGSGKKFKRCCAI
jgi:SEC-C motif-containing protein